MECKDIGKTRWMAKYNNYTKHTDFLILYIIYILSMFLGYQSAKVFILKTYIFLLIGGDLDFKKKNSTNTA
jgi:hypothetical protein